MNAKLWFGDFARGAALGGGLLPGVSVGTLGFIVHIYEKLIGAINDLRHHFKQAFLTLLPIALGAIISAIAVLIFVHYFFDKAGFVIVAACAGLTLGGLPVILKEFKGRKLSTPNYLRIAFGFLAVVSIGVLSAMAEEFKWFSMEAAFLNPNANAWVYPVVFLVGFVAAVACLIPGVSGSMVLFIAGVYNPFLNLFISTPEHASMFHDHARLGPGLILTGLCLLGVIVGLLAISKLMGTVLEKHRGGTFDCVLGFVLGSVVAMFINNQIWPFYKSDMGSNWWQFPVGAVLFVALFALLYIFAKKANQQEQNA